MTTVSKNSYFDVLDDIADEYNNRYQRTIKMTPIDLILLLNIKKNLMKNILNLK